MREHALIEVKRKLKIASRAVLSAKQNASARAEKAHNCCGGLENAGKRLEIAQIAAYRALEDAKTAEEPSAKFKADYVLIVERRRNAVGALSNQLRQKTTPDGPRSKRLAAVHLELESCKAKKNLLN